MGLAPAVMPGTRLALAPLEWRYPAGSLGGNATSIAVATVEFDPGFLRSGAGAARHYRPADQHGKPVVNGQRPVRRARYREIDPITDLVTAAVEQLPVAAWLVPDPQRRSATVADVVRIWVEHALFYGEITVKFDDGDGQLLGAAVWFNRYGHIPPPTAYEQRILGACRDHTHRFTVLAALLDVPPPGEPCQHLAFLATAPERPDVAEFLLHQRHANLDGYGTPAYTQAITTAQRDLFIRHGYQAQDTLHCPASTRSTPCGDPEIT
ncbi:hypothetical protein GCM10027290_45490 [Micromonospora sonneratiae]